MRCTYIDTLTGSGRPRTKLTMDNVGKRFFVTIKNNDNICLARALVVAQAGLKHLKYVRNETKYFYDSVHDARRSFQKLLAEKLI